ncbi:MAG: enoyl-CoA hydratase-related protein [Flavobacteriaceae bacterium]|nr:enoyl-CoA hydratase-related protein [Flavobacteriaceae bacterium]
MKAFLESMTASAAVVLTKFHGVHVLEVQLNRPQKHNALSVEVFRALRKTFDDLAASIGTGGGDDQLADVRCVVLTGGDAKSFCAGIDLQDLAQFAANTGDDAARTSLRIRHSIAEMQDSFTAVANCPVPVIVAIHGMCVGAGVDLICCADIRLASREAVFSIKEVDIAIAADLGTLQRLPAIVGNQSTVADWCYTARSFDTVEAAAEGLISRRVFEGPAEVRSAALAMAQQIAGKSPVAVHGTKHTLRLNTSAATQRGLDAMKLMNAALLQSDDIVKVVAGAMKKGQKSQSKDAKPIVFSKL